MRVLVGFDALVVGGPTHGFTMTRATTRADAVRSQQTFHVHGYEGPLVDGEPDRAAQWADTVGRCARDQRLTQVAPVAQHLPDAEVVEQDP